MLPGIGSICFPIVICVNKPSKYLLVLSVGVSTLDNNSAMWAQIHEDNNASDGVLDGSSKLAHDTKNPTALGPERNLGSYRTTTSLAHGAPTEFQKPQFARKPVVQESFYRRTNVFFPDGCATIATTS